MSVQNLTAEELKNMAANYRRAGKEVGGKYSLAEILLEQRRRDAGSVDVSKVFDIVCRQSAASADGLTTYGEVWSELFPETPWKGNHSQTVMGRALGGVLAHCINNGLPIVSVLVVNQGDRELTPKAVRNIYDECKSLGAEVGLIPDHFVHSAKAAAIATAKKYALRK